MPRSPCLEVTCSGFATYRGRCETHAPAREVETHTPRARIATDDRLVVIAGPSGVGKTELRYALAEELDLPSVGVDDCPGGWDQVIRRIDAERRIIVECVRLPRALNARVRTRQGAVLLLEAPADVLRSRLLRRGESLDVADSRSTQEHELTYSDDTPLEPTLTLDTTTEPSAVLDAALSACWVAHPPRTDTPPGTPTPARIYGTKRWRMLRRKVLRLHPVCQVCESELATDVDHRTAIEDGGAAWSMSNLQALCASCHGRKTAAEVRARIY